ncbi:MAG: fructosamine kinase family protein [Pseudonocardia sp.]|nr:fructosamine kinase family protein [Pseudonocardia sp.]ODU04650.1 MAG: fructosamine kinase [Pseudonocardia sp. SCN 72-51]ODV07410.1 MAG: fructosamine kinase [Pseudonocardia sp. SCN 73-27]
MAAQPGVTGPAVARLLGREVVSTTSLGGATRVDLADGSSVVAKSGPTVAAEAAGLRWLADAGGPAVAHLDAADRDWLVTRYVPTTAPTPEAAEAFGVALSRMHAAGAPEFGSPPPDGPVDAWIGTAPMRNVESDDWASWYAAYRVLPFARTARDAGTFDADDVELVEQVCARLPELAGPAEPPARLHGDLWSGNVLWTADGALLIDPAAHGGHRETDLAMLELFGLPHLSRVRAAYDEAAPLAPGHAARIPLHQLFPLLVHVVLFGGGYVGRALAAARAALRAPRH